MEKQTYKEKIVSLGERGNRQVDIAREVGTSRGYVSQIFSQCGLK